jgi:dTDP-4-amino-4,6-dideoxygalactose transaminase
VKERKEIHLFKAHLDVEMAVMYVRDVLESGFINEGVQVTDLTKEMSSLLRTKQLVLVNSCTSALTMALNLAGVQHDDDVVTTSMTCVATNMPIKHLGANIKWADVDPDNGMVTADTISAAITPKTKAVMVVLWAGNPYDLERIQEVCREKNVKLILDAAHGMLAKYAGKHVHNFADFTCYSFQAIKHVTTGDGGALVCSNEADFLQSKKIKWFGLDRDRAKDDKGNWKGQQWDVDIEDVGYKFNMNNVSAAIGLSQVQHVDRIISKHRANAASYDELFETTDLIKPIKKDPKADGTSWVYTVVLCHELASKRDKILQLLNDEGIKAGVVHVPNHDYTVFKNENRDLPGVRQFFDRQFSLPCGWWMKKYDVGYVFDRLMVHVENCSKELE